MLNIVLVEPEIPQNCGNIARTCAATGSRLHLIHPLGFDVSEKAVKRAGLDYWHLVDVREYSDLADFFAKNTVQQMWCLSTKAPRSYTEVSFSPDCYLFFLVKKQKVCRKHFWRSIGKAVSVCPCGRKPEA